MTVAHVDIESFSEADLKSVGLFKYAEHESTEILCLGYRFDEGPVTVWVPQTSLPQEIVQGFAAQAPHARLLVQPEVPADLRAHIESGGEVRAHNAPFERVVLNGVAGRKVNFPVLDVRNVVCTAAKTAASGLPRGLGDAASALGTPGKDDAGRISMLQTTKPKRPTKKDPSTRYTPENAPEKFLDLYLYNADDVLAEAGVDAAVPDLPPHEGKTVWPLDQEINQRGVLADLTNTARAKALIAEYKQQLEEAMEKATRPAADPLSTEPVVGLKPTQREKIAEWIRANGFPGLMDLQAETINALVKREDVPDNVKHVLRIYSTYNQKATSKFDTLEEMACSDGRLRGLFTYWGANTGRWSSTGVQLQNLARGAIEDPETAIEALASQNLDWIRCIYPNVDPMRVFSSCVRGMLVPAPGHDLLFADYAGIESRVNAWLFDERWKLEAFRAYDAGTGPDLYKLAYARAFQVEIGSVTKSQRQIGKVMELALGYEGGVGAFVTMVQTYGINLAEMAEQVFPALPEDVLESALWMWNRFGRGTDLPERVFMACDGLKQLWRRQHPGIVEGWKELKNAAELAVQFPGNAYPAAAGKLLFKVVKGPQGHEWLCMLLPSRQRMLRYFSPVWTPPKKMTVVEKDEFTGELKEIEREVPGEMHYMGIDTKTRRYMRTSTYGGKLCENAVQAISRDVLVNGMLKVEAAGYPIVMTVHDEIVTEPKEGFGSEDEVKQLMCSPLDWAPGLPLAVETARAKRYRK